MDTFYAGFFGVTTVVLGVWGYVLNRRRHANERKIDELRGINKFLREHSDRIQEKRTDAETTATRLRIRLSEYENTDGTPIDTKVKRAPAADA